MLYRPDQVTPDLDLLERSVSFLPFETLETQGKARDLGGGIQEYSLDFVLQAIDVEPSTSYPLETVVVYYDPAGVEGDEKTLRIQRAPLSVASYYPADVARIPLQPVKGQIGDQSPLRQSIMAVSGGAILLLALFLLWSHGRKRRSVELSEPEKLWQRKHDLSEQALGNREHLLGLEKIFTHLLEWRTQTAPGAFWAGADPVEPAEWTQASATARDLLSKVYQAEEPSGAGRCQCRNTARPHAGADDR